MAEEEASAGIAAGAIWAKLSSWSIRSTAPRNSSSAAAGLHGQHRAGPRRRAGDRRRLRAVQQARSSRPARARAERDRARTTDDDVSAAAPIHVRTGSAPLTIVASRSHRTPETDVFIRRFDAAEIVSVGSSLKFCLIASGEADLYPRFGRTMEWDTAAGDAVLRAAGGMTHDARRQAARLWQAQPARRRRFRQSLVRREGRRLPAWRDVRGHGDRTDVPDRSGSESGVRARGVVCRRAMAPSRSASVLVARAAGCHGFHLVARCLTKGVGSSGNNQRASFCEREPKQRSAAPGADRTAPFDLLFSGCKTNAMPPASTFSCRRIPPTASMA